MILTVTLNPCNDKTVEIPSFIYGGMNRIQRVLYDFSGKGFNVSRGVSRLGEQSVATGFLYYQNGKATENKLIEEGVKVDCVWGEGAVRVNTKIVDLEKRVVTELNESGMPATERATEELFDKIDRYADKADIMVLSGSIPPEIGDDIYARIIERFRNRCKILLDAEGKKLQLGIAKKPQIIKPNQFELETAIGRKLCTKREIAEACREILRKGVELVVVSLGADGAIAVNADYTFYAAPVEGIEVRSTVGAGDSMVAGLCAAFQRGYELKEAFRWGVAAASSCCENAGTELVTKAGLEGMLGRVLITEL